MVKIKKKVAQMLKWSQSFVQKKKKKNMKRANITWDSCVQKKKGQFMFMMTFVR